MKFSILVNSAPDKPASAAALKFCAALVKQSHCIHRIFFLGDGVLNSHCNQPLANDWSVFVENNHCEAVCCINSCKAHSLADELGGQNTCMLPTFKIAGLGQLVEASSQSDRLITFGQR